MELLFLRGVSDVIHKTRADKLIGRGYGGMGAIIMGTAWCGDKNNLIDPNLQISIDFLNLIIRYYIENGVDINFY